VRTILLSRSTPFVSLCTFLLALWQTIHKRKKSGGGRGRENEKMYINIFSKIMPHAILLKTKLLLCIYFLFFSQHLEITRNEIFLCIALKVSLSVYAHLKFVIFHYLLYFPLRYFVFCKLEKLSNRYFELHIDTTKIWEFRISILLLTYSYFSRI